MKEPILHIDTSLTAKLKI